MLNRRQAIQTATAFTLASAQRRAESAPPDPLEIIDSNVSVQRWPFRRLPMDDSASLSRKLTDLGVSQAWASSYEGILHRDISSVNRRLMETCAGHAVLRPVGCVNPMMPGWLQDLRQCADMMKMHAVRLYPTYHGYELTDSVFIQLLNEAATCGTLVQICIAIEDVRTQHDRLQVPDVNLAPLVEVLQNAPAVRIQILNARAGAPIVPALGKLPGVYFDTARVDGTDGVPKLMQTVPPERVLFGSQAPFLIPEAALIRTHESGQLNLAQLCDVLGDNARRMLAPV